jgi:hypothetical protein
MAMPLETRISAREGSWQQYNWVRESDVMVPMRDGVRLPIDIYRPALDGQALSGPFPVLTERTPYGKVRDDLTAMPKYFARRGYVVAVRDVRGRYDSGSEWYAFEGGAGREGRARLARGAVLLRQRGRHHRPVLQRLRPDRIGSGLERYLKA